MKNMKRLTQSGDTIVEVLICLAIFGAMLASAFALTSRNQATSQSAQERSSAVKVAESQLEKLRTYTDERKLPATPEFNYFCMNASGQPVKVDAPDAPGSDCKEGVNGRYSYVIYSPEKAVEVGGSGSSYAVVAKWEGAITSDEEVKIFYALYDSQNIAYSNPDTTVIPAPACSDGQDNDGDGKIDLDDPGCKDNGSNTDERDATTGFLTLSADCYAPTDVAQGCPEVRLVFVWSDGSQDVIPDARVMSRNGVFENVQYSFVKDPGVTLKRVVVQPASDKYDGSPSKDRNVYVKSLTNQGVTYGYERASLTLCDNDAAYNRANYPVSANSRFLCGVAPTIFFLDGSVLAACADGIDNDNDGKIDLNGGGGKPQDPGCSSSSDIDETDPPAPKPACSDGLDNDGDGRIDYPSDWGCASAASTSEKDLPRRPLYRCYQYNTSNVPSVYMTNHVYVLDSSVCNGGWYSGQYEVIAGYVPTTAGNAEGSIPMHGAFSATAYDSFYTISKAEIDNAGSSWEYRNVQFYTYPYNGGCSVRGTVPFKRQWSPLTGNHSYIINGTGDFNQTATIDGGGSYVNEGFAGCIYPANAGEVK